MIKIRLRVPLAKNIEGGRLDEEREKRGKL